MNVTHFLCASTNAHIFCKLKNVSVFSRVTPEECQASASLTLGTSRAHALLVSGGRLTCTFMRSYAFKTLNIPNFL